MDKIIFFTDFHAHIFTEFSKPDVEYETDRFREQMEVLQQVFDLARENKADIVFGGDLFHKRGAVDTRVLNHVFRVFERNTDIVVHLLRGNHDSFTNSMNTESSLETLRGLPNVEVYSNPSIVETEKYKLYMLPYGDEVQEMKDWINSLDIEAGKSNILVAHIGVEGALTGKGSHRLEGAFTTGDLRTSDFDVIALGHYHKRQLLLDVPNIFYGGNTIQNTFSDEGQEKGVWLIDCSDVKNTTSTFIPISSRKFITIDGDNIPDDIEELIEQGNFIRFIGSKEQAKKIDLYGEESTGIRVELRKEYTTDVRLGIDEKSSPEAISKAYAEKFSPSATSEIVECIKEALVREK